MALRRGVLRSTSWSISTQFGQLLLGTASWPAELAARLNGPAQTTTPSVEACPEATPPPRFEAPLPVLWLAACAREVVAIGGALASHDDWNIGVAPWRIREVLDGADIDNVAWLPQRRGRYAADPFGVERNGQLHILFEDFDIRLGKAVISATTLGSDGALSTPVPVLDPGCHASYPFLLEDDGEVWMIPETNEAHDLRLYRAVELPFRWELERRLLTHIQVSDPTIVWAHDRWWMFGTSRPHGVDHALRLWHAPALTGPWTIHREDPVKIDARSARPAGTPFTVEGVLYRPAQDCSVRYGGRVVINRVDVLTPNAFREVPAAALEPRAPYPHGLHTLSAVGSRTLIDGNAVRFAAEALPVAVRRRLGAR